MNEYKIEKGIPIPIPISTRISHGPKPGPIRATAAKLAIMESFLVPKAHFTSSISGALRYHGNDKRFTARTVDGGIRIWRIA